MSSRTSGHDGSSEGGRISSTRLPQTLVLYSVPLVAEVRRRGFRGRLRAEPAEVEGTWVLKLLYDGESAPDDVPARWHGHRVIAEAAPAPPAATPAPAPAPAPAASAPAAPAAAAGPKRSRAGGKK